MAPIRGNKRRKKTDNDVDQQYASMLPPLPPLSQPRPFDWWVDDFSKRLTSRPQSQSKDPITLESFLKLSRKAFDYIFSLVKEDIMTKHTNMTDLNGKSLSSKDRVAIALRRLSSGESLSIIGESLGIHQSTVSHVTWRFVEVMEVKALHHLHWPSTDDKMKEIKHKFEEIRGLPNCCGAIDTTHIMFCLSFADSSNGVWCDEAGNPSMILQAIVDPEMRFLDILTGWPGSLSDSHILQSSTFFKHSEEGRILNGKKLKLSEELELREYIIGDSGFPLLPWLLTPYQGRSLSDFQVKFNARLVMTQKVAQRALRKLKETWKIIQGVMWRPDKDRLPRIILVCCLLHNILIDLHDSVQDEISISEDHDPNYQEQVSDLMVETASVEREKLARYLSKRLPP